MRSPGNVGKRKRRRLAGAAVRAAPWGGMAAFVLLWLHERRLARAPVLTPRTYELNEPGRGRLAGRPPHIPAKGWIDVLWRTWREIGLDHLPGTAGAITFYTLLAIFPAIGAFVSLYGLFADVNEVSRQLQDIAAFVPPGVLQLLGDQMVRLAGARPEALSFAFVVSLLLSVWSANAGMAALFNGLNVVYEEKERRNFFVRRLIIYAFTFAGVVFMTMTTAILIAVPIVLDVLGWGETLLVPLRWVLLLGLAATAFAVVYRYGPSRERARWRWVRVGAGAAALAWVGGSLGYSWYLNNLAHYDATYGPLGAVIGFMMWVWVSVMVVLLGAELNAELEHQTARDSTTGPPEPLGARGARMADTVGESSRGFWALLRRQAARLSAVRRTRPRAPPDGRPDPRRSADR